MDMKRHILIPMMMISSKLFYVGWVIVVGYTKKIPNSKFIRSQIQTGIS
jgi:hypothetical protein